MIDYLYDESFEGFLTVIHRHYYEEKAAGIYPEHSYQPSLLQDSRVVTTDEALAATVFTAIRQKISLTSQRKVFRAFLSDVPGRENSLLNYLVLGFRLGRKLDFCYSQPEVLPVEKLAARVGKEYERMLGFLRFADMGRFLYAAAEPDHNQLPLLAEHFADRMARENFMIHDLRRRTALVHTPPETYFTVFDHDQLVPGEKEEVFQQLWREYFREIAIPSRLNPKLQTQFVPKRYRGQLTEFNG
jgi:probable DNA metabolism protein